MNGKGSARRPSSVNRETYEENWEMIFVKKKKSKKKTKKRSKKDEEKDID